MRFSSEAHQIVAAPSNEQRLASSLVLPIVIRFYLMVATAFAIDRIPAVQPQSASYFASSAVLLNFTSNAPAPSALVWCSRLPCVLCGLCGSKRGRRCAIAEITIRTGDGETL